ncbi:DinB family protein [Falsibacillus albus]|uniref:DinB family protein n=1 Tax=Falsibacillus albus TaxID=2478915 RepID=A0A3L7JPX7_9BACI|nr:DinB family protein [Falsibacillus albus]RLQ92305.1 DinB family protein [Falsibacillus albus]
MDRIELLINGLDSTYDKESWYAPLKDSIEGLTAEQARWKPAGDAAKSIWENLNHLLYYKERLAANLEGEDWPYNLSGDENFHFTEPTNDDHAWAKVVERVDKAHHRLKEILNKTSAEELDQKSLDAKLVDIFLHEAYHTGQIMQIRKLQGAWPEQR